MKQGVSRSDRLRVRIAVHSARNGHASGDNAQTQQRQLHLRVPVEHAQAVKLLSYLVRGRAIVTECPHELRSANRMPHRNEAALFDGCIAAPPGKHAQYCLPRKTVCNLCRASCKQMP